MSTPLTVECNVHVRTAAKGRTEVARCPEPTASAPSQTRQIARVMTLAIRFYDPERSYLLGVMSFVDSRLLGVYVDGGCTRFG